MLQLKQRYVFTGLPMGIAVLLGMIFISCKQFRQSLAFRVLTRQSTTVKTAVSSMNTDFYDFIRSRDWDKADSFWQSVVNQSPNNWPDFIKGSIYSDNDMQRLGSIGERGEFSSNDPRYSKKRNFAIKLGYKGSKFHGYQQQRILESSKSKLVDNEQGVVPELVTVEGSIRKVIRFLCNCAGRTDKGVHAISQIVNFTTMKLDLTPSLILKMLHELPEHQNGDMQVYDCVRVPKSFHARSSALWRRYQYIIPLKSSDSKDMHTIERRMVATSSIRYLNEILRPLVDRDVGYGVYSKGMSRPEVKHDASHFSICRILSANAYLIDLTSFDVVSSEVAEPMTAIDNYALCVELVGNRFLRQMVRKLVGTALREMYSFVTNSEQCKVDPDILLTIAGTSSPEHVERQVFTMPPYGLCFTGVGYDYDQLSIYKFMPKELKNRIAVGG